MSMIVKMGFVRRASAEILVQDAGRSINQPSTIEFFFTTNNPRTVIACTNFNIYVIFLLIGLLAIHFHEVKKNSKYFWFNI